MQNIREYKNCPECGAVWDAGDIYDVFRQKYTPEEKTDEQVEEIAGMYGWSRENRKHFSNLIGIEIQGQYDGVSQYQCPKCNTRWDRFTGNVVS